ncbi:C40 family peptidase [Schleiferilactobacillus perolens]|jgi:cell wall-associated NlpC family hydrolase|uniref:C40 family peptidase n=1 Tax=Schleiferilactobacillus perolens TaxID=100468 RepID=UPI0023541E0C|nr:C40 family peptidase [Schleiferilactobacillus perolens]
MKKSIVTLLASSMLAIGGIAVTSQINGTQPQTVQAATVLSAGNVATTGDTDTFTYYAPTLAPNYKQTLSANTRWKITATTKDANGNVWYQLGTNCWAKASDMMTDSEYSALVKAQQAADAAAAAQQQAAQNQANNSASQNSTVQNVINLAKQQIGKPYVWGGKGPSSFDCSGLMYYVFANAAGKNIGGWTVPQESAGTQVSVNNLQAGDLIFWGSRGSTYHVGLYIGNNQYIHAPQPGQSVTIASISSYFRPSFGVRVL